MNIEKLEKLLRMCYKKETAYFPYQNKWSKENPTCGQCAITSLVVQNYFGGAIHRIKLINGSTHYFNIINEQIIDLTQEQFEVENIKLYYEKSEIIERETILKNNDTKKRYYLLLEEINKLKTKYYSYL